MSHPIDIDTEKLRAWRAHAKAVAEASQTGYTLSAGAMASAIRNGSACLVCGCYESQHDFQTRQCPPVMLDAQVAAGKPTFTGTVSNKALISSDTINNLLQNQPEPPKPAPEKPATPIHEMRLADYRRGVDAWWPSRAKS